MYLQFHSVKEPSENYDIWVRVLFASLRVWLGSWQNLGSRSVLACWVRGSFPSLVILGTLRDTGDRDRLTAERKSS